MIIKTFDNDLDGILSKIGGSKRSIKEWGKQNKHSSTERQTAFQRIGNTLSAFFTPKKDWKTFTSRESITKNNINTYIPKLNEESAGNLLLNLQNIQQQASTISNNFNWDKYFKSENNGEEWQTDFIQNTDLQKASTLDLMKANENACKGNGCPW